MIAFIITNMTENTLVYCGRECYPETPRDLVADGVTSAELLADSNTIVADFVNENILINNGTSDISDVSALIVAMSLQEPSLKTIDHRYIMKQSSRPMNTSGLYTSRDDDPTVPGDIGNGNNLVELDHKIGDSTPVVISQRFNVEGNRSWIFEGYVKFSGCKFDRFCFYISAVATPFTEAAGTNFLRYSPKKLILPSNGNGDVSLDTSNLTTLCSVVPRTDSGLYPTAYWNATYNPSTGKYDNLTPAPLGNGRYNIFYEEFPLKRYLNNIALLGEGMYYFNTSDPSELGSNLKCNYMFTTSGTDHDWQAISFISMFREKIL